MYRMLKFFAFLQIFCLSFTAQAIVIDNLYEAKVEIQDQTQRSQDAAIKRAFRLVLVKVSGNRELLRDETIKRHIQNAKSFLLSYQFDIQPEKIFYEAEFDAQSVEKIIRFAGFPIWGKHRPDSIIWLALQDPDSKERELITRNNEQDELFEEALETAVKRGVGINFPVLDLIDLQQVSVYDVWNSFTQTIVEASERYPVDFIVSASIFSRHEESWVGQWTIAHKGRFYSGEIDRKTPDSVLSELVEILADKQSEQYALGTSDISDEKVSIVVGNINKLSKYIEVSDFLNSLTLVLNSTLVEQDGNKGIFELELFGDEEDLVSALLLDDRISVKQQESDTSATQLEYVWNN